MQSTRDRLRGGSSRTCFVIILRQKTIIFHWQSWRKSSFFIENDDEILRTWKTPSGKRLDCASRGRADSAPGRPKSSLFSNILIFYHQNLLRLYRNVRKGRRALCGRGGSACACQKTTKISREQSKIGRKSIENRTSPCSRWACCWTRCCWSRSSGATKFIIFNTKSIISDTKFIISDAKFITLIQNSLFLMETCSPPLFLPPFARLPLSSLCLFWL